MIVLNVISLILWSIIFGFFLNDYITEKELEEEYVRWEVK